MTLDTEKNRTVFSIRHTVPAQLAGEELNMGHKNGIGAAKQTLRLLVPITAMDNSRWGVKYALHLHEQGNQIEIIFLNVGEIITDWQALRFRAQAEMARFQSERAEAFFDEASGPLLIHDIPFRGVFRRGDPVFCIPDTAEEFDCHQIVMPLPPGRICRLFSKNITGIIMQKNNIVRIITVDQDGRPVDTGKKPSS